MEKRGIERKREKKSEKERRGREGGREEERESDRERGRDGMKGRRWVARALACQEGCAFVGVRVVVGGKGGRVC